MLCLSHCVLLSIVTIDRKRSLDERERVLMRSDATKKFFTDEELQPLSPSDVLASLPTLRTPIDCTSCTDERLAMIFSQVYRVARCFFYSDAYRAIVANRQRARQSALDKAAAIICNFDRRTTVLWGDGCRNVKGIGGRRSRMPVVVSGAVDRVSLLPSISSLTSLRKFMRLCNSELTT